MALANAASPHRVEEHTNCRNYQQHKVFSNTLYRFKENGEQPETSSASQINRKNQRQDFNPFLSWKSHLKQPPEDS